VGVVREQFNFSNAAAVLFQVADQLTAADLPNTNVALHSAAAEELTVACQLNRCNAILVCIVNLPKHLAIVNSESSDSTIGPTWQNNFICKYRANRVQRGWGSLGSGASCSYRVVVTVPQSDGAVFRAGDELVTDILHEPYTKNGSSVVLAEEHLAEIVASNPVDETAISAGEKLQTIRTYTQAVNAAVELLLQ